MATVTRSEERPGGGTAVGAGTFASFVDDASALVPDGTPGAPSLQEATAAFIARTAPQVGRLVLRDTDVPLVRGFGGPLTVAVTGGAGQVAGPAGLCRRLGLQLDRLEVTLRDLDDLSGNARRVTAAVNDARESGALDDATHVHVVMPASGSQAGWLAAADEVAACEHRLTLPMYDVDPATLLRWIDAALDRETPFACTRLRRALPGADRHGFLSVLVATGLLFDGLPDPVGALAETSAPALLARGADLARARRWFTSFDSTDVEASLADLTALDLTALDLTALDLTARDPGEEPS